MPLQYDEIDRHILQELQEDARISNRELASLNSITLSYTYFPSKAGQPVAESKGDAAKSSL